MTSNSDHENRQRNIKLLVEYDGSNYVGWQIQDNGPSIQGTIAAALTSLGVEHPVLHAAGRTDAGVHALGQVASFLTTSPIPAKRFASALNPCLPSDISIHHSDEVERDFHARHSAKSKRYRYTIYSAPQPAALMHSQAWYTRRTLDIAAMQTASLCLLGEHDFESFRSTHCDAPHARRTMHAISFACNPRPPAGAIVEIVFHANAFCRHMCRILAGTLVEVGLGRRTVSSVEDTLAGRRRELAGITAPGRGLTLLEVYY